MRVVPETWTPILVGIVALCVLLYGFSKTAMPVAGVFAGPLLAAALGVTTASGFVMPLLVFGDLFALAFADDDGSFHVDRLEGLAHGLHGGLIGALSVALPHGASGCNRGFLYDAYERAQQVPLNVVGSMFS